MVGETGSGKTTLLQALAAKLDKDLRVGHDLAYVLLVPFCMNNVI